MHGLTQVSKIKCIIQRLRQASLSLQPGGPLAASEETLEEAHGMWVPPTSAGSQLPSPLALSHFANLKALTLQVIFDPLP